MTILPKHCLQIQIFLVSFRFVFLFFFVCLQQITIISLLFTCTYYEHIILDQRRQMTSWELHFLLWWPWSLTLTLTFYVARDVIKVKPHTKFHDCWSNSSAVRVLTNRYTDSQTDGTDYIPLATDAGGNNQILKIFTKSATFAKSIMQLISFPHSTSVILLFFPANKRKT